MLEFKPLLSASHFVAQVHRIERETAVVPHPVQPGAVVTVSARAAELALASAQQDPRWSQALDEKRKRRSLDVVIERMLGVS
ncbi:MAG: hypothetical protein JWN93_1672 [Hyphomicrobiales bacterium]|nr:hypothetical protein [Hyphomicrobiales bacterium]